MPQPTIPHTFGQAEGDLALSQFDDNFTFLLNLILQTLRGPMNFADVSGSPFQLNSGWQRVATITSSAKGLIVADTAAGQAQRDIFWTSVPTGSGPPGAGELGVPVGQIEHFLAGLPVGDLYLRSVSGAVATVQLGS